MNCVLFRLVAKCVNSSQSAKHKIRKKLSKDFRWEYKFCFFKRQKLSFFQTLPRCDLSQCKVEEGEEMDEENGEVMAKREPVTHDNENLEGMDNMEISSNHREPEVDEDGFQMVSKKKGGRKK